MIGISSWHENGHSVRWLVVLRIYVALAVFHPYPDLEAGHNQSLKFKWRDRESNPGRTSCSASQELNHYTTAAPILGKS